MFAHVHIWYFDFIQEFLQKSLQIKLICRYFFTNLSTDHPVNSSWNSSVGIRKSNQKTIRNFSPGVSYIICKIIQKIIFLQKFLQWYLQKIFLENPWKAFEEFLWKSLRHFSIDYLRKCLVAFRTCSRVFKR